MFTRLSFFRQRMVLWGVRDLREDYNRQKEKKGVRFQVRKNKDTKIEGYTEREEVEGDI